jgi:thioredoxin reductase/Fe-S-cluster-containing hydrogenase component 2/CRP-like cAMP-binding protein
MTKRYDIAIIGSGPAGLSAAGRAAARDREKNAAAPTYLLLEGYDKASKTIQRYQKGKFVMAEPGFLNLRSDFNFGAGSREQILGEWDKNLGDQSVNIRYQSEVKKIRGQKGDFHVTLANGEEIVAGHVVLAIGLEGNPRKLGAPGEDLPRVQYHLDDPGEFSGETIIVVGAGDSAIENALALAKQNRVYIVNRRGEFSRAKEGNLNAVLKAISDPRTPFDCFYNTGITRVDATTDADKPLQIVLNTPEGEVTVPCDRIIARLGGVPPREFVEACGVVFPSKKPDAIPALSATYESNVPGLYIIGSLAGYPLIKQAMNQGYDVVEYINGNRIKPADSSLLEAQFKLLPYVRDVDDVLTMFQQRIPMFSRMNALAFRELIIESDVIVSAAASQFGDMQQQRDAVLNAGKGGKAPRITKLVRAGDALFEDGDYTNTFFTIVEGEVEIRDAAGNRKSVLKRGQFFGENSLLSGRPREGSAVAGKDCIIVETPRRIMVKLLNSNDEVRAGIDWMFIVRALQKHFAPNAAPIELKDIADKALLHTYRAGDTIYRQGDAGDSLYILRKGSVTLNRGDGDDAVIVAQLQSGELLGEMALMGDPVRRDTATCAVACDVIELKRPEFLALIERDSSRVQPLQERVSTRLKNDTAMQSRPETSDVMQFLMQQGLGEATNALIIDQHLCIGCDNCEKACAETHGGISRLNRHAGNAYAHVHVPISCRHCEQPHCMKDCPPNAINRAASGEVFINESCIGCGNCQTNCPYGVIRLAYDAPAKPGLLQWLLFGRGNGPGEESHYHPDSAAKQKGKKAVKCDACVSVASGPACVSACPTGAAFRLGPDQFIDLTERR